MADDRTKPPMPDDRTRHNDSSERDIPEMKRRIAQNHNEIKDLRVQINLLMKMVSKLMPDEESDDNDVPQKPSRRSSSNRSRSINRPKPKVVDQPVFEKEPLHLSPQSTPVQGYTLADLSPPQTTKLQPTKPQVITLQPTSPQSGTLQSTPPRNRDTIYGSIPRFERT